MAPAVPGRPVLAGNGLASIRVLDLMLEAWSKSDVLVIAPPEGGYHTWQPSLANAAAGRGVAVMAPPKVNEPAVLDQLRTHRPDLLLSVYYTQLFRSELLGAIDGPALNFHPSLLPRHRGTAPLIWAIADGDAVTGVSVHHLTSGIDTGPLVDQRTLPIHPDDTGYTLHMKATNLVAAGAAAILRSLLAGDGVPKGREQAGQPSYHSKTDPALNHLDWSQPRQRIRNIVRALAPPLPGAYSVFRGHRVNIDAVRLAEARGPSRPIGMSDFRSVDGATLVWASDGPVAIEACRIDGVTMDATALQHRLGVPDGEIAR